MIREKKNMIRERKKTKNDDDRRLQNIVEYIEYNRILLSFNNDAKKKRKMITIIENRILLQF